MTDAQKKLSYITNYILRRDFDIPNIRAITAYWREKDHTACISHYFDGPISNYDFDEANDLDAGIIAQFPDGILEEKFIRLDFPSHYQQNS